MTIENKNRAIVMTNTTMLVKVTKPAPSRSGSDNAKARFEPRMANGNVAKIIRVDLSNNPP